MKIEKTISFQISLSANASESSMHDEMEILLNDIKSMVNGVKYQQWRKQIYESNGDVIPLQIEITNTVK